eukprot:2531057-Pleurochrysis_carterae.AAC.1
MRVARLRVGDADVSDDGVELVAREQVGQLARVEEDVDVLEEALVLDLLVGKHEGDPLVLHARAAVERLEVLEQRVGVVHARDGDLEEQVVGDVRAEAGEALFAAAADADQERAAAGHGEHAGDAHHVPNRVIEEYEVHLEKLERLVELGHVVVRARAHVLHRGHGLVDLGRRQQLACLNVLGLLAQKLDEEGLVLELGRLGGAHVRLEHLVDGGGEPALVVVVDELVREDAHALVLPQLQEHRLRLDRDVLVRHEDALEDAREVAQVENVVELGRGGQHLGLDHVPNIDGHVDELLGGGPYLGHLLLVGGAELGADHGAEDLVDRGDGGQRHVHHVEVALGAVRDIVLAAAGVQHRAQEEQVDDRLPLSRLVQVVQPDVLDELAHDLERDLISPRVDLGHREIVDKDDHLLAAGRAKRAALALLDAAFDVALEDERRRGRGEGELLVAGGGRVELGEHLQDARGLGGARAAHEEHGPALLDREVHVELVAHRVDRRYEERRKLAREVRAAKRPRGDARAPVLPVERAARLVDDKLKDGVGRGGLGQVVGHVAQALVHLGAVIRLEDAGDGPDDGVDEEALERLGPRRLWQVAQQRGDERAARGHERELGDLHLGPALSLDEAEHRAAVLVEELAQLRAVLGPLVDVGGDEGLPAQVGLGNVDDAGAGDGGGRGVAQVLNLEMERHVRPEHRDAVVVGEREDLVVVHHSVH